MKTKILILSLFASIGLMAQTKIKIAQLENPATSSLNLGTQTFSVGNINSNGNLSIDQSGGINSVSPKKFSFQPYTAATTLPALYLSQNIPSSTNYFVLADSSNHIINAPYNLTFKQGNQQVISILGSQVNGVNGSAMANGLVNINTCPSTTTAQATTGGFIPSLKISSLTYSMTNATVSSPYLIQVQAPNIKSNTATTITEWVTMNFPKPTFDANITCTRMFGIQTNTDVSIGGNVYVGANSIAPTARLHFAAPPTGTPCIKFTTHTIPTLNAGEMDYNSTSGWNWKGNLVQDGNGTVVGTFSTGSTYSVGARILLNQGADVASTAGAMTLGTDGNVFEITGTNAITLINNGTFKNGSEITLLFTSTATLTDGTANSGANIGMELQGNANFVATADDSITLTLSEIGGTQRWREKCRSVN